MKNINILCAIIICLMLSVLSTNSFAQPSNTMVSVTCASGAIAKNIEVKIYKVDATTGMAINPCKCTGPKCVTNEAQKKNTDNSGNANFSGKTGLEANTNYIATVNSSCLALVKCDKMPNENCRFTPGNETPFTTNANGGTNAPVVVFNGACRLADLGEILSDIPSGNLSIIPNPAQQKILINANNYGGKVELKVVNVLGRQVISKSLDLKESEIYSLNISSLEKGIYKVVVSNGPDIRTGTFIKE